MAELRIGSVGMSRLAVQPSSWLGNGFLGIGGLGIGTLGIAGLGIGTLETGFVDLQVVDNTSNGHSLVMIFVMLGIGRKMITLMILMKVLVTLVESNILKFSQPLEQQIQPFLNFPNEAIDPLYSSSFLN